MIETPSEGNIINTDPPNPPPMYSRDRRAPCRMELGSHQQKDVQRTVPRL